MNIILQTNDPNAALSWLDVERYVDDSGFGGLLQARTLGFAAEALFTCTPAELRQFAADVRSLDQTLRGSARLEPMYDLMFVELEVDHAGVVIVRGQIQQYQPAGTQRLEFALRTDQTCLRPFADSLHACLSAPAI